MIQYGILCYGLEMPRRQNKIITFQLQLNKALSRPDTVKTSRDYVIVLHF
jgi:hypothetical protein